MIDSDGVFPRRRVPGKPRKCEPVQRILEPMRARGDRLRRRRRWGQPPTVFAIVPTALVAAAEPSLLDQLDDGAELTPIEQESLPTTSRAAPPRSTSSWPRPRGRPRWSAALWCRRSWCCRPRRSPTWTTRSPRRSPIGTPRTRPPGPAAESHPDRREARLIAAVLRDGPSLALLQLRPTDDDDPFAGVELRTYDNLAPGVVSAL